MVERIYALLLMLYPREFRERFGTEMMQDFRRLRTQGDGMMNVVTLFGDAVRGGVLQQMQHPMRAALSISVFAVLTTVVVAESQTPPELRSRIRAVAAAERIDAATALALVSVESNFDTTAVSPGGAIGLTQIMPATASWVEPGVTAQQLRRPEKNLQVGFRFLRRMLDRYDGNLEMALRAYAVGPGNVDKGRGRDEKTTRYVNLVLEARNRVSTGS